MIIEPNYLGYLKYEGEAVEEGLMDARMSADALIGFDRAFRHLIEMEDKTWEHEDINLPVRIEKGCWQILVPAGITIFAGYYLKSTAERAGTDGWLETGIAKDLNRVLSAALLSFKWIIKISKHVGSLGDKTVGKTASIKDMNTIIVPSLNNIKLEVPRKYFDIYCECPKNLLGKNASLIDVGRELEIGTFKDGMVVDPIRILASEKKIFHPEPDEDEDILFPDLVHGMTVQLKGEITRATESENTLGFRYEGHVLSCKPETGRIAFYKKRIISQQDGHIFPKVRIYGIVDRRDKYGGFKARRPCIVFSDVERIDEPAPPTLF